jgi:hypothetical protein
MSDIIFQKRPMDEILNDAKNINVKASSNEILTWIINNVENFMDNHMHTFKLDLVLESSENMLEIKKLQDLYRALPDDKDLFVHGTTQEVFDHHEEEYAKKNKELEKYQECRIILDGLTKNILGEMKDSKDLLEQLYKRMSFYYEKIIPSDENRQVAERIDEELKQLIIKKQNSNGKEKEEIQQAILEKVEEGQRLVKFQEVEGVVDIINFEYEPFSVNVDINETKNDEKMKQYVIPEGFTCWVQISVKNKMKPLSMF